MPSQDFLQSQLERSNADFVFLQLGPRLSLLEEPRFYSIAIGRLVIKICLSRIADDVPAKLQGLTFAFEQVEDSVLSTAIDQVWLYEDAHSSKLFLVHFVGHLQDLLSGNVHVRWDHCQEQRAGVVHVAKNHVANHLDVFLRCDT